MGKVWTVDAHVRCDAGRCTAEVYNGGEVYHGAAYYAIAGGLPQCCDHAIIAKFGPGASPVAWRAGGQTQCVDVTHTVYK